MDQDAIDLACALQPSDTLRLQMGLRSPAVHVFLTQDGAQQHILLRRDGAQRLRDWLDAALRALPAEAPHHG